MKNVAVKFVAGITNLVGNSPFLLVVLWFCISDFGGRIVCAASDFLAIFLLELTILFSLFRVTHLHLKSWLLPLGGERGRMLLKMRTFLIPDIDVNVWAQRNKITQVDYLCSLKQHEITRKQPFEPPGIEYDQIKGYISKTEHVE